MPNLGPYGIEILIAYAGSASLFCVLVVVSVRQHTKAVRELSEFGHEQ